MTAAAGQAVAELPAGFVGLGLVANLAKLSITIANVGELVNKVKAGTATSAELTSGCLDLVSSVSGIVGSIPGMGPYGLAANAISMLTNAGSVWLQDPAHAAAFNEEVASIKNFLFMTTPAVGADPATLINQSMLVPSTDDPTSFSALTITNAQAIDDQVGAISYKGNLLTFSDGTQAWVPNDPNSPIQWTAPNSGGHDLVDNSGNAFPVADSS
jgi:hypothetical protein